jgi:hypothetical protein
MLYIFYFFYKLYFICHHFDFIFKYRSLVYKLEWCNFDDEMMKRNDNDNEEYKF